MTGLTTDLGAFEQEFLALEAAASAPYSRFAYASDALTRQVQALLFERGVGEFVPPAGRLLILDGRAAAMVACLTGAALQRARLGAAMAVARSGLLNAAVSRRVQLAGQTLLKPSPDDYYLSRIAAHRAFRGRGLGSELIEYVLTEARRAHAPRCLLEVAPEAGAAIALYRRHGFEEVDRQVVEDPETGSMLEYVHMQRSIA